MKPEKSVRQIVNDWNARAKAEGKLLEQAPSTLPALYEGSILDIRDTPESLQRIERLKQQIAELKQKKQAHENVDDLKAPKEGRPPVQPNLPFDQLKISL